MKGRGKWVAFAAGAALPPIFAAVLLASSISNGGAGASGLFAQTAAVTVANSAAETSLIGAGAGSTVLPAGFFSPGGTVRIKLYGVHSAALNPSVTVRVKMDGAVLVTSGLVASNNSTNELFEIDAFITCYTAGAGGTAQAQGSYMEWNPTGNNSFPMGAASTFALDTTAAHTLDVSYQWSAASASNTVTASIVVVERIR